MIRVYVAGPYSSDPAGNTARAIAVANDLLDRGFAPFVPHLTMYLDAARPRAYVVWLAFDLVWLACCDVMFRMPGDSPGADGEVAEARDRGMPVVESVEALEAWREGR